MGRDFSHAFYKSADWQRVRDYCMKRDQWLCRDCLANGIYTPAEEVHHIIELDPVTVMKPEVALNPDNCVSLCRECHRKRHGAHPRRYTIDELGRVTIK